MKVITFNNITFIIGQSAKDNWDLLDNAKRKNNSYIWFHLNSFPSPYVIMYTSLDELEKIIKLSDNKLTISDFLHFGAVLCKNNSKYKFLNDLKILYLPLNKISKSYTVGEVIITGKKNIIKL